MLLITPPHPPLYSLSLNSTVLDTHVNRYFAEFIFSSVVCIYYILSINLLMNI